MSKMVSRVESSLSDYTYPLENPAPQPHVEGGSPNAQYFPQQTMQTDIDQGREKSIEPIRRIRHPYTYHHTPPKRFHRTFWRGIASRAVSFYTMNQ